MSKKIKVSKAGKVAYRAGLDGCHSDHQLLLEIIMRTGEIDDDQLISLAEELEKMCGSSEQSLLALKLGKVGLERV